MHVPDTSFPASSLDKQFTAQLDKDASLWTNGIIPAGRSRFLHGKTPP